LKPKRYNLPHFAQLRYAKNPLRVRYKQALQNMVRIKTVSFSCNSSNDTDPVAYKSDASQSMLAQLVLPVAR
jgi:hypothetical protein